MRALALFLLVAFLSVPAGAKAAPSFDCAKAATEVEKRICADATLSDLDQRLAGQYSLALANSGKMREGVIALQRVWLARRAASCKAEPDMSGCLRKLYESRLEAFSGYAQLQDAFRAQWVVDQAFPIMVEDPRAAEKIFRLDDGEKARLGLAVTLRLLSPQTERNKTEVAALLKRIKEGDHPGFELADYDGSEEGLVDYLAAASDSAELPCALFERFPPMVHALEPRFYSSMDHILPYARCEAPDYILPASVGTFLTFLYDFSGEAFDRCTGTMRFGYGRESLYNSVVMTVLPQRLLARENAPSMDEIPLQRWAYHNLSTWHSFQKVKSLFLQARLDLAGYYEKKFGLSKGDALRAAHAGIWTGLEHWTRDVQRRPDALRSALLDPEARPTLQDVVAKSPAETLSAASKDDDDPPLLLAVGRPDILPVLLSLHADVTKTNAFGKNALMTAAQFDQLESARLLLKAGVPVNAVSLDPDAIPNNDPRDESQPGSGCGLFAISNGSRTALMYAAANASLPMIELLLGAGADKKMADSEGSTSFDYLTGQGPVPANPRLTGEELEKAKALLTVE